MIVIPDWMPELAPQGQASPSPCRLEGRAAGAAATLLQMCQTMYLKPL